MSTIKPRFIYQNYISDASMMTASSLAPGLVTSAMKVGTGDSVIVVQGNFTGQEDMEFIVEIDVEGTGELGSSTYRWTNGSGGWNASGVTTSTSPTTLSDGVKISFTTTGTGDFILGDKWYFKGINLYNTSKMLDLNRDTRYRSSEIESPNRINLDILSAQEVSVVVIQDHNFSPTAVITIDGDTANTFDSGTAGAPEFTETISWSSKKIIHYMTTLNNFRYWRINIDDVANLDRYIEISELLVGKYMELSKSYDIGPSEDREFIYIEQENIAGTRRFHYHNVRSYLNYEFSYLLPADADLLKLMYEYLNSKECGTMLPFWFNDDYNQPERCWLVNARSLGLTRESCTQERYNCTMDLEEVVTSL